MTTAWTEPPGRDDRPEGQDVAPPENQLELFETEPSTEAVVPSEADSTCGGADDAEDSSPAEVMAAEDDSSSAEVMAAEDDITLAEVMAAEASAGDFADADAGGVELDSEELRRLEDSIRWLMNESSVRRMPSAASLRPVRGLPPVRGLSPLESLEGESLLLDPDTLLNPDTLFPPQLARRRGRVFRGVAKMLLVSAVAAPAAYLMANWMQLPATPTDSAAISDSPPISGSATTGLSEQRIAALPPSQTPEPGSTAPREMPTGPNVTADAGAVEPNGAPEVSAAPSGPAPTTGGISSDPPRAAAPAKPPMNPLETKLLVERGQALFEAGDVAAARLFFRRAANAGDAAAAVAMGATYDPDVLAKRFIRGIEPDAREARTWYERARALGSPEGPRRIEILARALQR